MEWREDSYADDEVDSNNTSCCLGLPWAYPAAASHTRAADTFHIFLPWWLCWSYGPTTAGDGSGGTA